MLARCAAFWVLAAASTLAQEISLTRVGDSWQYLPGVGEASVPPAAWRQVGFDDQPWLTGPSGFSAGFSSPEATLLPYSPPNYVAVYFRRSFTLADPAAVKWLTLRMDYSDGFVAYLNGQEIARRNLDGAPGSFVPFDRRATNFHARGEVELIDLTATAGALLAGTNTLAVQLHDSQPTSLGLCFNAELLANFTRAPHLQNLSSNQVQIIWRTAVPSDTTVDFGPGSDLSFVLADTNLVTTHAATLTNLRPDSVYSYRASSMAGAERVAAPAAAFRTFKTAGGMSFIAMGDAGWNSVPQYQIAALLRRSQPDFVIEAGDNVYPSFTAGLVDLRCFSVYQEHMMRTPYFFALGNHDLYAGVGSYLEAFYLPTNSVSLAEHALAGTSPEHYYAFDQGDAHVAVLFVPYVSQSKLRVGDPQYTWLTNDLATTRQPWKIVVWHVPMNSSCGHRFDDLDFNGVPDRLDIREVLLPVMARYGVQLVLNGHEHGYERFNPTNGVQTITTAGAGVGLYAFTELDVSSALFWPRYNCVRVSIDGDALEAQALDPDGNVFDAVSIRRALPARTFYRAAWHSPFIPATASDDGAGNIVGQTFDFVGEPIPTLTGQFSNLGRAYVNNDRNFLFIGLERVMIYGNNNLFLFIDSPRTGGVTHLNGLGNRRVDPDGQGADGLDFLSNVSFTNFNPSVACILGDEWADGQFRNFARTNLALNIGQGAFQLTAGFPDVTGVRLQQFHLAPQFVGLPRWQNAGVIQLAIPFSELGGLQPGDRIRIGAIVAGEDVNLETGARSIDTGFLGNGLTGAGSGPVLLEGLEVQLAADPEPEDLRNLRLEFALAAPHQLRLSWAALPGYRYHLEVALATPSRFVDLAGPDLIAVPPEPTLSYELDLNSVGAAAQFYRVRVAPRP